MRQRASVLLLAALAITLAPLSGSDLRDPAVYRNLINDGRDTIHDWEVKSNWALGFTAVAFVAGVLVTLLQSGSGPWLKKATIGLGTTVALITGLKPILFSADYRVLQRSAVHGRQVIKDLEYKLDLFDPKQDMPNLLSFYKDFREMKREIDRLEKSLSSDSPQPGSGAQPDSGPKASGLRFPDLIQTVHAQSSGVQQRVPSNDSSFFFAGQASSTSLDEAQQTARKNALRQAARFFLERTKGMDPKAEPPQAFLNVLLAASNTAKSSYEYDRDKKVYTFSISLEVSKSVERLDLQSFRDPEVTVVATQRWKDTGIAVQKGDIISFTAQGEIQWDRGSETKVGPDGSKSKTRPFPMPYPVRGFGAGGLIAKVGTGEPFKIGAKAEVVMTSSGVLSLGINDNSFGNNKGEFRVTIVKVPAGK